MKRIHEAAAAAAADDDDYDVIHTLFVECADSVISGLCKMKLLNYVTHRQFSVIRTGNFLTILKQPAQAQRYPPMENTRATFHGLAFLCDLYVYLLQIKIVFFCFFNLVLVSCGSKNLSPPHLHEFVTGCKCRHGEYLHWGQQSAVCQMSS
jgi:hypothetical protein